jgi:hypothetical protein
MATAQPAEEDTAPRRLGDDSGETLTAAQKGAILAAIDEKKRTEKKQADAILAAKKSAALGIKVAKRDGGAGSSSSASAAAGTSKAAAAAGGGLKAIKALSPEKKDGGKGKAAASAAAAQESPRGSGVKAALALKGGKGKAAGGKEGGGAKKKGVAKGKGGLLAAAKEEAEAPAPAPAAPPPETAEEARARLVRQEKEREGERERVYKEREEQRREIEQAIWAEERRLREKEQKKRANEKALKKLQKEFREAAFDGELEDVKKTIDKWVQECFGATLIGAKIDSEDEHKTTALSEAACAGMTEVCALLLKHGAAVNSQNEQGRTPLFRAAFMGKQETCELLLKHGADPRIKSETDTPETVAPTDALKEVLGGWSIEDTERLMAEREVQLASQWVPPPPDPEDAPAGEAGYFLQIQLRAFADALDAVNNDSDRPVLVCDLGGKVLTYFEYRDCNLHCYARAADIERERLRRGLVGALRFGKPFVLDMMGLELDRDSLEALFDDISPGLFGKILSKKIYREEHYLPLVTEEDPEEYSKAFWSETTTAHFAFVLLSKAVTPPEWAIERFFVIRCSG